jgi:hypothetical protein
MFSGSSGEKDGVLVSVRFDHQNLDQVLISWCIQTMHTNGTVEIDPFPLFRMKIGVFDTGIIFTILPHNQQSPFPKVVPDFKYNAVSHH